MKFVKWILQLFSTDEVELGNMQGGINEDALYALYSESGNFLSLDPKTDTFTEVSSLRELRIWDYQSFGDEETWFMGKTPRPKIAFTIRRIPPHESKKLK